METTRVLRQCSSAPAKPQDKAKGSCNQSMPRKKGGPKRSLTNSKALISPTTTTLKSPYDRESVKSMEEQLARRPCGLDSTRLQPDQNPGRIRLSSEAPKTVVFTHIPKTNVNECNCINMGGHLTIVNVQYRMHENDVRRVIIGFKLRHGEHGTSGSGENREKQALRVDAGGKTCTKGVVEKWLQLAGSYRIPKDWSQTVKDPKRWNPNQSICKMPSKICRLVTQFRISAPIDSIFDGRRCSSLRNVWRTVAPARAPASSAGPRIYLVECLGPLESGGEGPSDGHRRRRRRPRSKSAMFAQWRARAGVSREHCALGLSRVVKQAAPLASHPLPKPLKDRRNLLIDGNETDNNTRFRHPSFHLNQADKTRKPFRILGIGFRSVNGFLTSLPDRRCSSELVNATFVTVTDTYSNVKAGKIGFQLS
uniref:Uncharacterized protein n=1 Tax=Panagrellus redivivus TaxID=6233 RepID=A0A7E4VVG8_PANRE